MFNIFYLGWKRVNLDTLSDCIDPEMRFDSISPGYKKFKDY